MPGNTKKRRRKGRGTQGGRVSDRAVGRPRNRAEARQRAQQRRAAAKGGGSRKGAATQGARGGRKEPQPASWKGAIQKGVLASLLFFGLFAGIFKRPLGASAALGLFTLVFYVPLSYYLDGFMYRRYQANLEKDRRRELAAKEGGDGAG